MVENGQSIKDARCDEKYVKLYSKYDSSDIKRNEYV